MGITSTIRAKPFSRIEIVAMGQPSEKRATFKTGKRSARLFQRFLGCFTSCLGDKGLSMSDDEEEPLLQHGPRKTYRPRYASISFLRTATSRKMQEANEIL